MKSISLKIEEHIFEDTEKIISMLKKPRNRYINEAIASYNEVQRRKLLEERLKIESLLVRDDSMEVLKEFERTETND